jgi:hypothetical protein
MLPEHSMFGMEERYANLTVLISLNPKKVNRNDPVIFKKKKGSVETL